MFMLLYIYLFYKEIINMYATWESKKRLYKIWDGMHRRCYEKKDQAYKNYGARGIIVCDKWHDFNEFLEWVLMSGYDKKLSIDRIDNNKGYSPENCKWSTKKEQANNRRTNRMIVFNGEEKTVAQWSEKIGIKVSVLQARLNNHGWTIERALTMPLTKELPRKIYNYKGTEASIPVLAKMYKMNVNTIYSRIKMGWPIDKAMTKKIMKKDGMYTCNGVTKNIKEWAKDLGTTPNALYLKMKRGKALEGLTW